MLLHNKILAVLFDLDGVIAFTDRYHYLGWKRLADEQGWHFDEEVNRKLRGVSRLESLQHILDHNDIELSEADKIVLADKKNAYYVDLLDGVNEDDLYPGAVEFARALRQRGCRLALCSSSCNADRVLDCLGLRDLFETVVTGHDITRTKPDPEIFELAAGRLNVHPFHCLVFEDAASGIEAAAAAHMKCIGIGPADRLPGAAETTEDYGAIDPDALLETGHLHYPTVDRWRIIESEINPRRAPYWESLFALTNGVLGLRGAHEEDDDVFRPHAQPGFFVNGIYDYDDYHHVIRYRGLPDRWHGMLNLCDWRIVNGTIEGEPFSFSSGTIRQYRRDLDMRKGITTRTLEWESPSGKRVAITSRRVVSMVRRQSAALSYEVKALNFSGEICIESVYHGSVHSRIFGEPRTRVMNLDITDGGLAALLKPTRAESYVAMALGHHATHQDGRPITAEVERDRDTVRFRFPAHVKEGASVSLEKYAVFYASGENPADRESTIQRLAQNAADQLAGDMRDGLTTLLAEQEAFWADWWSLGDIVIKGNDADQQAVRFNLFHLRQSHPERDHLSISATGTTSDGYNGHVFWDTEMYMVPYFNYTDPALVRPLLMYRYSILDKAREQARLFDCPGAMFSWNSMNGEECGIVFEAASGQLHLNNAVAFAIAHYYRATDDRDFMYGPGAEILFETARFFAARGRFCAERDGQFGINVVCGPDEYGCNVDNNCYTNVMTQWHFRFASAVYDEMERDAPARLAELGNAIALTADEIQGWRRRADRMYIPYDSKLGIHKQDDQFLYRDAVDMTRIPHYHDFRWEMHPINLWRTQVIKQADLLLLMFTQGHQYSKEQKQRNYAYYEPRTNHGSSLSPAIHCLLASELDLPEHRTQYFRDAAYMDLFDLKNNTGHGVHSACLGGVWMAVVNGLAGMRDDPDGLTLNPCLPSGWQSYTFHLRWQGRLLHIAVDVGQSRVRLCDGPAMALTLGGQPGHLSPEAPEIVCG